MMHQYFAISLMLIASVPSTQSTAIATLIQATPHLGHIDLAGRDQPSTAPVGMSCMNEACPTPGLNVTLPCDAANGTQLAGTNSTWTLLCDIDFPDQDIYPFILAKSFDNCLKHCEDYNNDNGDGLCAGFVFSPDRSAFEDDCYLKSSLHDSTYPAAIHLIGAALRPPAVTSTSVSAIPPSSDTYSFTASPTESIVTPPRVSTETPSPKLSDDILPGKQPIEPGKMPTVTEVTYLGTSVDEFPEEYVSHAPAKPQQLAGDILEAGINIDLITDYPMAEDTGSWTSSDSTEYTRAKMKVRPRISRDGGRGGNINGTNVFIFCDTSTYGEERDPILGYLNGFVSTSVAVDESMNGLDDRPLTLSNSLGQWQDDVGRMRGWVPMTTGEEAFNIKISGQGYRYAIWPSSSPININNTHAVIHAPLVYLEIDMNNQDQGSPRYTTMGNTLILVTIDPIYGPHAERLYSQFFTEDEINWGSLGGIRAWDASGIGSDGGEMFVFGEAAQGVLLGKVAVENFGDRSKYTYWNGHSWSDIMPTYESTSNAYMIDQQVMNMDLIYSPAHKTFIMIYLVPEVDNTFYYRYLVSRDNSTPAILPPYVEGGDEHYVENLVTQTWSEQKILFTIPKPARGFAYAGGIHAGYFGDEDITLGGSKVLCTWTEHTQVDPEKPNSGYAHKSRIVELGFVEE